MAPLVWLVTGTTSGIGRAVVEEIVARGDKVIASGRKVEARLGSLKSDSVALLELDVAGGRAAITAAIQSAWAIFGHIDVLLNNAGISSMGSAEEATDAYITNMFNVNLFGQMHVTAAILPLLRAQGHGVVAFTSSSTAWTPLPFMSHYAASKAALSAYVESLRKELKPLGIDTVAFECGGCVTHLGQPREEGAAAFGSEAAGVAAYGPGLMALGGMFATDPLAFMPGDPAKVAASMVDVVKREGVAAGKPWAVRVILGSDAYDSIKQKAAEILTLADAWKNVSYSTDRDGYSHETQKVYLEAVSIIEKE